MAFTIPIGLEAGDPQQFVTVRLLFAFGYNYHISEKGQVFPHAEWCRKYDQIGKPQRQKARRDIQWPPDNIYTV